MDPIEPHDEDDLGDGDHKDGEGGTVGVHQICVHKALVSYIIEEKQCCGSRWNRSFLPDPDPIKSSGSDQKWHRMKINLINY